MKQEGDAWVYIRATSSKIASEVEGYFIKTIGTDGEGIDHEENADIVYIYKKATHTDP